MTRTKEQWEKMKQATMSKLWLRHSFLGYLNSKIPNNWVETDEHNAPAWTDNLSITINLTELGNNPLFENITTDQLLFLTAHELYHIINFTTERRGNRIPELWNISADYVINADLLHNRSADGTEKPIGEMPNNPSLITPENPKGYIGCYNRKYLNMTIEQVYDLLYQENKDEIEQALKEQEQVEQALKEVLDKILNGQQVLDINKGVDSQLDPTKAQQIRQEIKAKINTALQEMGKSAGQLDSSLSRVVSALLAPPKFDWKGFLSNYIKSFLKSDKSWQRLSRRTWGCGNLLSGIKNESQIKLAVAIDTSGSIDDKQVKEMLSHIKKIMTSFKSFDIDIWCFSTKVHRDTVEHYTKGNVSNLDTYNKRVKSNGGTDIASNFKYIAKHNKNYNVFICMTDGYDNIDNLYFNKCPVIWAITGNNNFTNPKQVRNAKVMYLDK